MFLVIPDGYKTECTTHMAKLLKSNVLGGYKNRTCTTHMSKHWLKGGLKGHYVATISNWRSRRKQLGFPGLFLE